MREDWGLGWGARGPRILFPARSWRETVWLLDVMWPKVTNERARCWEKICSYIKIVDTESSYKHPWRGVVHHCGPCLFLLSVAGDVSFISFTGVAWDGKWEWWPRHMPENQRVLPSWSSWESICYVGIKISKLYELRNIMLLERLALDLCSYSTYVFFFFCNGYYCVAIFEELDPFTWVQNSQAAWSLAVSLTMSPKTKLQH